MSDTIARAEEEYHLEMNIAPERLAWSVLLIAFATFCIICVASTLIVYYFLFQSPVSLDVTLHVGRGTVGVTESAGAEQAETRRRSLSRGDTFIRTDSQDQWSQAVLSVNDSSQAEDHILTIIMKNDTSLLMRRANRPRFEWSTTIYEVSLRELEGEIDVVISDTLNHQIELSIMTVGGDEVLINRPGRYLIDASANQLIVTSRIGEAIIISADRSAAYAVPSGQQALFNTTSREITRIPYLESLLINSELQVTQAVGAGQSPQSVTYLPPFGWSCTNGPASNLPIGNYFADVAPDGRHSFRLFRDSNADTNGYTRCVQSFLDGLDVTTYDFLQLQATFYVDYQSLNGCGQEGSECPFMLRFHYKIDHDGDDIEWIHGVYTVPLIQQQELEGWKRQCGTCLQPHIRIHDSTWYVYESGNLFDVIPDDRRPAIITQVEFFAEGHQYDVYVDEVTLLGRPHNGGDSTQSE